MVNYCLLIHLLYASKIVQYYCFILPILLVVQIGRLLDFLKCNGLIILDRNGFSLCYLQRVYLILYNSLVVEHFDPEQMCIKANLVSTEAARQLE